MPSDYAVGGLLYNPNPTPAPDYLTPVGQGLPGQVWVTQYVGGSKGQTPIAGFWDYPGGGSAFGNLLNTSNLGSSISDVTSGAAQAFTDPTFLTNAAKAAAIVYGAGQLGGALGLGGAAGTAPAIIDSAGNLIGGELASGVATSAPVTSGTLGGWTTGGLMGGAAGTGAAQQAATNAAASGVTSAATTPATSGALTPAAIESAVGTAGYGTNAAASAATGAASGAGAYSDSLLNALGAKLGLDSASVKSLLGNTNGTSLLSGLLNTGAGLVQGQSSTDAAKIQADAQIRAAQIAADAAKFKPVGVTTGFGSSQFGYDANGNLTSAGYQLTPQMQQQRDQLIAQSGGLLNQFQQSQQQTMPMQQASQQAMQLGNQYLMTSPQAQAQKYYQDQMALLAPSRADAMAQLQAQMQAQGRGGFAIGGGVNGQGAANPQLQALLNAQMQQDTQLAANATQGGMDYAKFGAGMVGTGGDLLSSVYGTQTAAFNPYKTALGGAQTVEGLGQNALDKGISLGSTVTAANANAGSLLGQGVSNAAQTMAPANAYSPWANILGGGANMLSQYKFGQ